MHRHSKTNQKSGGSYFFPDFPAEHRQVSWCFCRWLNRLGGSGSAALVLLPTISPVSLAQGQQRFGKGPGSPSCPSSSSGCGEQKAQSPSTSFKVFSRFSAFRLETCSHEAGF